MKDSLTIAGFVVAACALIAGIAGLVSLGRRRTYTPGPPQQRERRVFIDDFVSGPLSEGPWTITEGVNIIPRNLSKPWPPPRTDSWSSLAEQNYWYALFGRPGPRGPGMTAAACHRHPERTSGRIESWHDSDEAAGDWLDLHRTIAHGGTD